MRWPSTSTLCLLAALLVLTACQTARRLDMQKIRAASLGWQLEQASIRNIDVLIDDTTWTPESENVPEIRRRRVQVTAKSHEHQELEQSVRDTSEVHGQQETTKTNTLPETPKFFSLSLVLIVFVFIGFLVRRLDV